MPNTMPNPNPMPNEMPNMMPHEGKEYGKGEPHHEHGTFMPHEYTPYYGNMAQPAPMHYNPGMHHYGYAPNQMMPQYHDCGCGGPKPHYSPENQWGVTSYGPMNQEMPPHNAMGHGMAPGTPEHGGANDMMPPGKQGYRYDEDNEEEDD
jgi:hypothetical protein